MSNPETALIFPIVFRGNVRTLLGRSWEGQLRVGRVVFPIAGLWATALFMLAHVNISVAPFSIRASALQQVWALGLGFVLRRGVRTNSKPARAGPFARLRERSDLSRAVRYGGRDGQRMNRRNVRWLRTSNQGSRAETTTRA
jgi:hypothetical protein